MRLAMEIAKLVLEFVKVLVSAPVVAGIAVIFLSCRFSSELRDLIGRISGIKSPGGGEFSFTQSDRAAQISHSKSEQPTPSEESLRPEVTDIVAADRESLETQVKAWRSQAYLWEYRYLNFFLVPHTQQYLEWLANRREPITVSLADSFWIPIVPDANERHAMLNALLAHHLVQIDSDLIKATEKGREYLDWRGPSQSVPWSAPRFTNPT
jgi:hypothetical protein